MRKLVYDIYNKANEHIETVNTMKEAKEYNNKEYIVKERLETIKGFQKEEE